MLTRRDLGPLLCALLAPALAQAESPAAPKPDARAAPAPKPAAPADGASLAAAQERLALALIPRLAAQNRNAMASPMGLARALGALSAAGDAAFARGMLKSLSFSAADAAQAGAAEEELRAAAKAIDAFSGEKDAPLVTAARLLLDRRIEAPQATLDGLNLRVSTERADLASPEVVSALNAWVKEKTHDLIGAILDRPPGAGGIASLDAIYFKDRWKHPFDPARTADAAFASADGKTAQVKMMGLGGAFLARREAGLAAAELPFKHERFSLVLVTTTDAPATAQALAKKAEGWFSSKTFAPAQGDLFVPKLELSAANELLAPMRALGLPQTPLVGLGARPPRISSINQRAVFKMDETGAEAAAATAVVGTRSVREDYVKIRFDKPFLFALKDKTTGFVVMAGYFSNRA